MTSKQSSFQEDLRVPIGFAVLLQALMAAAYIIPIESSSRLSARESLRLLEPFFFLSPFVTLGLHHLRPWAARWFAVVAPALLLVSLHYQMNQPGLLALLILPVGLAFVLIGQRAGIVTASLTIAALILLAGLNGSLDPTQLLIAAVSVLTIALLLVAVLRPVQAVADWSWNYYQKGGQLVEETRVQRAELEQALKDLEHANRQMALLYEKQTMLQRIAEEAERTKSAFVAKVSHEFRTPLNMIIGLAGVMIENAQMYGRSLSPALLEDVRIIQRNCEHLSSMVNDVLALSQAQSGQLALHREPVHLDGLILGAIDVIQPLLKKKNLNLEVSIPTGLPEISCDRTRIRQVFLNLLSNAARFTDTGGISVAIEDQEQSLLARVVDTGPGIAPQDAEKIFEPFCQGSEQGWRDKGGSGLGLTISKQFVELHGGRIWMESQPGRGTTFFVSLPKRQVLAPAASPDRWISQEWTWSEARQRRPAAHLPPIPRAVIFDQTQQIVPALAEYADRIEMVELDQINTVIDNIHETPAHLVLLGGDKPREVEALVRLARRSLPDTPVAGWVIPEQTVPALAAGASLYLVKPIRQAVLFDALRSLDVNPHRVLIADDDPDVRLLMARMIKLFDPSIEVVEVSNGQEVLEKLRQCAVDLLLLDLVMPGTDGMNVLEAIRQDQSIETMKTIIISAQDPMDSAPACEQLFLAMGDSISLTKAMECTLAAGRAMIKPETERYPAL